MPSEKVVELFERWQRLNRQHPNAPRYKGYSAQAGGLVHWRDSYRPGETGPQIAPNYRTIPVDFGVEPIKRRTPAERLEQVTATVCNEAMRTYRETGKVLLARSVIDDILKEAWRRGEPLTRSQVESLAEHEIRPMCERYAAALLQRVERKHGTNDRTVEVAV